MSKVVTAVPACAAHVAALAATMRPNDVAEIESAGLSVQKSLWRSYRSSIVARSGLVGDEVGAMWGVVGSSVSREGRLWFLTGNAVERISPVAFVRLALHECDQMLNIFSVLWGYVAAGYAAACRLLDVLGFTLSEPFPFGIHRAPFRRYEVRR